MIGFSKSRHGVTLLASIGAAGFSLCIVEEPQAALSPGTTVHGELPPEGREKAQAASLLKQLLDEKIAKLIKSYGETSPHTHIRDVYVVLHAPISLSQVVTTSRSFQEDVRITDALLDECARAALGDKVHQPDFLGARLLQVRLNGYPTSRPEGKHVREMEVIGLASTVDVIFREPIMTAFRTALPQREISMRAGILAIAAANPAGTQGDSLVVYLSAEGTEIVVVRDGVPGTCTFVPLGIRAIAERAGKGAPAETLLGAMRVAHGEKGSDAAKQENDKTLAAVGP